MHSIYFETLETPIGTMHVAITPKGIAMLEYPIPQRLEAHKHLLLEKYSETKDRPETQIADLQSQIDTYFNGTGTSFDLPLDLVGSPFQCRVWNALREIPYGKTVSYLELATRMEEPKSVRAVAQANGQNRLAIIIPCHRIIGSSGKLTGYSGGIWRKEALLSLERGQETLPF